MKKIFFFTDHLIRHLLEKDSTTTSNDIHISEAMKWLRYAQKMTSDKGISAGFHMYHGWLPPYPETTGYLIETFFDYAKLTGDIAYKDYAINMANWLHSIQNHNGSISDSSFQKFLVFDTGQVVFGFVKTFKLTGDNKFKNAAIKAGNWIVSLQEKNGSWVKHAVHNIPHTYYARVAWSLLTLYEITSDKSYLDSCKKNIEWCLTQQEENGWFNNASFNLKNNNKPFTHTIAYTIRGILEAGIYLKEEKFISSAIKSMDNLLKNTPEDGSISGTYNNYWKGDKRFCCLTGNAQLAIILFKIYMITKNDRYFIAGKKINNNLKVRQELKTKNVNIHGAIAGSYPIWGRYIHFCYPNWASKFFVDSLMIEMSLQ